MIITVQELRRHVDTAVEDQVLEAMLQALELSIHGYTNNNFARVGTYPMDIKMGVINLMKWELTNRDKAGIASESISRHSVTYFDMTGDNSAMGYPKALTGFLRPYMKARFGQGLRA